MAEIEAEIEAEFGDFGQDEGALYAAALVQLRRLEDAEAALALWVQVTPPPPSLSIIITITDRVPFASLWP